jgi:pyruvate/2-oxoglutarate dehydrogenase complex dihydrolipoamide dehydrogenase (E3) component
LQYAVEKAKGILLQNLHRTHLLIPGVGFTKEQLKQQGTAYKVGSFPFKASGHARASMATDGFVKVLADKTPTKSWACT